MAAVEQVLMAPVMPMQASIYAPFAPLRGLERPPLGCLRGVGGQ